MSPHSGLDRPTFGQSNLLMDLPEVSTHTFVIRLWLEASAGESEGARWRGHITHVPTGTQRSVQHLADLTAFVGRYLEQMGVRLND